MTAYKFNTSEAPSTALPVDIYLVKIKSIDLRSTRANTGKMLVFSYQIAEGNYAGQIIFDQINIENNSKVAENMGKVTLKKICKALGIDGFEDTDELLGKHLNINLKVDSENEDRNIIRGYMQADGVVQPQVSPAMPESQPIEDAQSKPAWE